MCQRVYAATRCIIRHMVVGEVECDPRMVGHRTFEGWISIILVSLVLGLGFGIHTELWCRVYINDKECASGQVWHHHLSHLVCWHPG